MSCAGDDAFAVALLYSHFHRKSKCLIVVAFRKLCCDCVNVKWPIFHSPMMNVSAWNVVYDNVCFVGNYDAMKAYNVDIILVVVVDSRFCWLIYRNVHNCGADRAIHAMQWPSNQDVPETPTNPCSSLCSDSKGIFSNGFAAFEWHCSHRHFHRILRH